MEHYFVRDTIQFSSVGFEKIVLSVQRRSEMLENTQIGKGLAWSELQSMASFMDAYSASEGSIICRQSESRVFLSIICRGRVDIIREDLKHKDKIIASVGPGFSLGEMSLIDGLPHSATVIAHTPVELLALTVEGYEKLAEEYPRLWGKLVVRIAEVLCRRLRQTSGVLAEYLEN